VPLTTVSMATISQERMGFATSLFNLMRNIGGSVGIAITATIPCASAGHRGPVGGAHQPLRPHDAVHLAQLAKDGSRGRRSRRPSGRWFWRMPARTSMVSFVMLFRLLGVVFLMVPLVFIMRGPAGRATSRHTELRWPNHGHPEKRTRADVPVLRCDPCGGPTAPRVPQRA
jgi:DHA2 family multidrug resistance protein